MFAVIELQGHQYIVREGDTIVVDKLELEDTASYTADKVLLIAEEDGTQTQLGAPYIDQAQVVFDVVTDFQKGEKIRVLKFKRKNRYQRIIGFRPHQTVLLATKIGTDGKKATKKVEKIETIEKTAIQEVAVAPKKEVKKETVKKEVKTVEKVEAPKKKVVKKEKTA
ncbi:MAG: 50S ribosomal protein L21 [Candidatus Absconditabacterales bacterium]